MGQTGSPWGRADRWAVHPNGAGFRLPPGHDAWVVGTGPVPLQAAYSGSATFTSQSTVSFLGSGTATHMGRITNVGSIVLEGPDGGCSGGIANVNTETLTDPDGDTLTITSQDVRCQIGPNQFDGTGPWTVTGGTGRLAGATGQGRAGGGAPRSCRPRLRTSLPTASRFYSIRTIEVTAACWRWVTA